MHCCLWFRLVFRVQGPWPKRYGYHLSIYYHLCDVITSLAKKICIQFVYPKTLEVFVACKLIALDKYHGVRPIEIGETLHHTSLERHNIQDVVSPLQFCASFESGTKLQYVPCSSFSTSHSWMPWSKPEMLLIPYMYHQSLEIPFTSIHHSLKL